MSKPAFRLVPEWDPQRAVLINWPQPAVNLTYIEIVKAIALTQSVMIICYDIDQRSEIQSALIEANVNLPRVRFYIIPAQPARTRDHSPFTLRLQEQTKILNFSNNGWAEKYTELYNQSFFPQAESNLIDLVLEGGSVETDGFGTLLATPRCVLNKNRDHRLGSEQIEVFLKQHLGLEQILWLDECYLEGDSTSGHIDSLVRFVNPQTICYTACQNSEDTHFQALTALKNRLSALTNHAGQPYQLLPLPLPDPVFDSQGNRLPATYTKFLITNHLVLLPFYQTPQDVQAKNVLQSCFPTREVVGIPCLSLLESHGSIHGIALQIPV